MAESFFATLECELIDRRRWRNPLEARQAVFTYIEGWYNPRRRHSALGYLSPAVFEARNRPVVELPSPGLQTGIFYSTAPQRKLLTPSGLRR